MRLNWTRVILVGGALLLLIGFLTYRCVRRITAVPRGLEDYVVYVPSGAGFDTVVDRLLRKGIVTNEALFRKLSEEMNYARPEMRSGRYEVEPGWTMVELVRHLRGGEQSPVDVVLSYARLPEDIAGRVAEELEPDSAAFARLFADRAYLAGINFTPEEFMTLFIPNTYELFWNVSPRGFVNRMIRENKAFWGREGRLEKASRIGLSPREVYTLASIVQQETNKDDEKDDIAGVYLNRLKRGMRLQADPTAVFARRDFGTRRVTWYHTKYDSPYNTYLYKGLPPGPICMASISSIDAVLNARDHDYLFFCAKGDGSGYHAFAETLEGHNLNAARYRANLRRRGLR